MRNCRRKWIQEQQVTKFHTASIDQPYVYVCYRAELSIRKANRWSSWWNLHNWDKGDERWDDSTSWILSHTRLRDWSKCNLYHGSTCMEIVYIKGVERDLACVVLDWILQYVVVKAQNPTQSSSPSKCFNPLHIRVYYLLHSNFIRTELLLLHTAIAYTKHALCKRHQPTAGPREL